MTDNEASMTRRVFMSQTAAAGAAIAIAGSGTSALAADYSQRKINIFSKHLQWLDYEAMADFAAECGLDGIDLSVRPRGHVLPENVERDLPRAVKAIKAAGLNVDMMTTAITDADDPLTEKILDVAGDQGVKYYRMGYLSYDEKVGVAGTLEKLKPRMAALAKLNEKHNIHGAYQNHAGIRIGGPVWDLWELLKDLDPRWTGCEYDIRHAVVEGGNTWPLGMNLLMSHIKCAVIKDFYWGKKKGKWAPINCPLGEGMVDLQAYFDVLNKARFDGPFSLHFEYDLPGKDLEVEERKRATKAIIQRDIKVLKPHMA